MKNLAPIVGSISFGVIPLILAAVLTFKKEKPTDSLNPIEAVAVIPDTTIEAIYQKAWNAGFCAGLKMYPTLPIYSKEGNEKRLDEWYQSDLKNFKANK